MKCINGIYIRETMAELEARAVAETPDNIDPATIDTFQADLIAHLIEQEEYATALLARKAALDAHATYQVELERYNALLSVWTEESGEPAPVAPAEPDPVPNEPAQPTLQRPEPSLIHDMEPYRTKAISTYSDFLQEMAGKVIGTTPEAEQLSWPTKEAAARAWMAGNASAEDIVLLDAEISTLNGTPPTDTDRAELATLIIANANAYRVVVGTLAGLRRAANSAFMADTITTPDELDAAVTAARQQAEATIAALIGT